MRPSRNNLNDCRNQAITLIYHEEKHFPVAHLCNRLSTAVDDSIAEGRDATIAAKADEGIKGIYSKVELN